ncbi:MATH and LRR domain-containing protein PFE0570w-like [Vespula pensylvanica]|uniref:MATH and LRR domain-containing protein PFE0570w-like n=1 Tax=Vespula pensylvanica TaxID=30213 RepID=UPI001CBA481E|nr:MATH and LRR domain-containing protein PFE0570w-like [Vespula pensylvanica]
MNTIKSLTRDDIPIIFDNYKLKWWLFHAGPRRQELLQKLKRDLEKLNLSRSGLRQALLQLTTKSYVVVDRLSKEMVRSIGDKDGTQAFAKRNKFIPFLHANECNRNKDDKNKIDLNNTENIKKTSRCSEKRNDKLNADSTLRIVPMSHCRKPRVADNRIKIHGSKFKHKIKRRKEYSSDKYKVKRCKFKCDYEKPNALTGKKVSMQNNTNGVISGSNDTNTTQVPLQINRQSLRSILDESNELREKEFSDDKSCYFAPKTMEADSAVSNDKKNDNLKVRNGMDVTELKTIRQCELCETVIIDKIKKNCNISNIFNQTYPNANKRKRKKIRAKFHEIFDQCLTVSEEEEEESIINAWIRKRQRKDSNKSWNVSTNIESSVLLDKTETQDTTSDLVVCKDIVCRKTCEIASIELVETILNATNVIEFNNNRTVCDKDVFTVETKLYGDDSIQKENIINFPLLCDNNEQIEIELSNELPTETANVSVIDDISKVPIILTEDYAAARKCVKEQIKIDLSNELPTKTTNVSAMDDIAKVPVIQAEDNATHKCVKESAKLTESINLERDALRDFNRNFNDTNVKVLNNYAIKIRTLSERSNNSNNSNNNSSSSSNSNNNDDNGDKIIRHISRNSCSKKMQLDRDSDGSCIRNTISNTILNSDAPVEKILEKSSDRENCSKTSEANTSFDIPKKIESTMNNFRESCTRNVNDDGMEIQIGVKPYSETTTSIQKNPNKYKENVIDDNILKPCKQDVNEDLSQLLQMNINQNYKIRSIGNTISIQENVEAYTNQNIIVKDICISDVTSNKNQLSADNSTNTNEETIAEESLPKSTIDIFKENNNTSITQNDNEKINDSSFHTTDFKQHTSLDSTYNFVQPKTIQKNKIRVLSSAELGSRWCPTPVNTSVNEPNVLLNETTVPMNDNGMPSKCTNIKQLTKDAAVDKDPSLSYIQFYLMSIYRRIMRIRALEKKYSSNGRRNASAGVKKIINNDMQFNSNFVVLLEELLNLGKELKISDLKKVIRYAASAINKCFLSSKYKPISLQEISNYMTVFDKSISQTFTFAPNNTPTSISSNAFTFTSNNASKSTSSNASTSAFSNAFTSTSNNVSTSVAPVPKISNSANNAAQAVLSNVQNLHVPAATEVQAIYNDLPKKNVYASVASNQNQECNVPNLQTLQNSNASILYAPPPVQSMYKNVQLLQESRMYNYGQRAIQQQQFIPAATFYNAANSNVTQSHNNKYTTRRLNLNQNLQGFIRNNAEYASQMAAQSNIPQRIDNTRDMSKLSYTQQVPQQITLSYNVPQRFPPIQMAQNIQNSQISCSMTLSTQLPTIQFNNSENLQQRTNTIPCELLLQIWDQVTFCLEENFFDCRAHEIYDKGSCILKLFHMGWKEKIYKFIRYKSQHGEFVALQSKLAKYIYKTAVIETQKRICQLYLQRQESQERSDTMKILIQDMTSKNNASSVNLETQYPSKTEARKSKSQRVDNVELKKQSDLHSLKNAVERILRNDTISSILQNNNSLLIDSNKFDNKPVSIDNEMDHNGGIKSVIDDVTLENKTKNQEDVSVAREESVEILSTSTNKGVRLEEFQLYVKEESLSPKRNITDNIDHRQVDSIESAISSEPHIIDVRSISPTSFNTMEEVLALPLNDLQLSTTEDTKENGIEIKIQIPEDVICLNCSKISTVVCEVCLEAHYCSKECAASHWIEKHHKYCMPHHATASEDDDKKV